MAVLSNGMNVESITAMFGNSLPAEVRSPPKNPVIRLGMAMQKMTEPANVTFRPLYVMDTAKQIRDVVKMQLCYLGGARTMNDVDDIMDAGFDALALGRALIFDPKLVNNLHTGNIGNTGCTACNQCVTMMYTPGGTACVEKGGQRGHDPALNTVPASAA